MAKPGARALLAWGGLLWIASQGVQAEINLTIRGEVLAPPACVINGGKTLNVPFGDNLMTTRIDGVNYRKVVPYTVLCNNFSSNAMTLTLQGVGAGFDAKSLKTTNTDLGINLFVDAAAWPLNTTVDFTYPTLPRLEAVPVRSPGSTLKGGSFSAVATLVADLQ